MADPSTIRFLRLERTSDSVLEQLDAINQVSGVQGWMIGTSTGDVLLTSMRSTFDLKMLDTIGDHVIRCGAGVLGAAPAIELEIDYTQGSVLAQKIGAGWLTIFCNPQADLPLARLTCGVTASALSRDRALQSELGKSTRPPPSSLNGSFSSAPRGLKYL